MVALADAGALFRTGGSSLELIAASEPALAALDGEEPPLALRAVEAGRPLTGFGDPIWSSAEARRAFPTGWALAIPAEGLVLLLLRTDTFPFAVTEIERARCLADLAAAQLGEHEPSSVQHEPVAVNSLEAAGTDA